MGNFRLSQRSDAVAYGSFLFAGTEEGKTAAKLVGRLEEFFCFVQGKGVAVTFTIGWQRSNHHNDG
jgi:hypothetical protein